MINFDNLKYPTNIRDLQKEFLKFVWNAIKWVHLDQNHAILYLRADKYKESNELCIMLC